MISKRIFSIALTWLAAMSMHAGTYTFKIAHPEEGAKLRLTWCASNEIMDVDVVNGVVTVKKDGFTPEYVQVRYGKSFSHNLYFLLLFLAESKKSLLTFLLLSLFLFLID